MKLETRKRVRRFVWRSMVGYFGPLIALIRLRKKRNWHYWRQMRVMYRYVTSARLWGAGSPVFVNQGGGDVDRARRIQDVLGRRNLAFTIIEEDRAFVATIPELDVSSEGDTAEEALDNLLEAVELYFLGNELFPSKENR